MPSLALAPERTTLVAGAGEIDALALDGGPVAVLAQTTLQVAEVEAAEAAARRRFGEVWTPSRSDICDASTTRQAAVRSVAAELRRRGGGRVPPAPRTPPASCSPPSTPGPREPSGSPAPTRSPPTSPARWP